MVGRAIPFEETSPGAEAIASVPKKIVLLSDGTGNAASKVWRTNVWRLFQALDLTKPDDPAVSQQVAFYDDGVGTSAFKPLAFLGGAFGWGLKRNVLDLYTFLCRNYEPGSEIYAFGFSRGAFTIRVLVGLIASQGIVAFSTESELQWKARVAYRAYRSSRYNSVLRVEKFFRGMRDLVISALDYMLGREPYDAKSNIDVPSIRFIGVWDTVAAYGLPIEEMTRGVSQWLWPLEFRDRELSSKVRRACHALALDDERTTFHPLLWTEAGENPAPTRLDGTCNIMDERISQVWFPGVHSNVGGGYPDDSLAHLSLYWMMQQASHNDGLRFKLAPDCADTLIQTRSARDKDGRLYDSRQGLGGYYRYGPRKIQNLSHMRFSRRTDDAVEIDVPKIHEDAFQRTLNGAHVYAPVGLPERYAVVMEDGRILEAEQNPFENPERAAARAGGQEEIWNLIWKRRVTYFATLGASFYLALFPLIHQIIRSDEYSTPLRIVSESIRFLSAFTPGLLSWWFDAYASRPGLFLIGVAAVVILIWLGVRLRDQINDGMQLIWRADANDIPSLPDDWIYKLRSSPIYQSVLGAMKRHIVPFISAIVLLYLGLSVLNRLAFNIEDAAGLYCHESLKRSSVPWQGEVQINRPFPTGEICWASGVNLEEGLRYYITVTEHRPWMDRVHNSNLAGYELSELSSWIDRTIMFLAIPMRRIIMRPWFRIVGRVGTIGSDEYYFDPNDRADLSESELSVTLRPRRSGEFFMYVNDAVVGIPGIANSFYQNNRGEALIKIRHLPR